MYTFPSCKVPDLGGVGLGLERFCSDDRVRVRVRVRYICGTIDEHGGRTRGANVFTPVRVRNRVRMKLRTWGRVRVRRILNVFEGSNPEGGGLGN